MFSRSTRSISKQTVFAVRWNSTAAPSTSARVTVRQTLQANLKTALRAKDSIRANTIRSVLADVLNAEKLSKTGEPPGDLEVLTQVHRGISHRKIAVAQYQQGNRPDLVQQSEQEIAILQELLPPQLTPEDVDQRVQHVLEDLKTRGERVNMGSIMKAFWEKTEKGRVTPAVVSQRVKAILGDGEK